MAWLYNPVPAVLPDYSSTALAEYWVRQFLVFSSGGFPVQSASRAPRHVRPRSALASSLKRFSHYAVRPGPRPVSFPGSGDPHVFPAQSGVPGIFTVPASTGLHTGVPDGSSLLVRPGYRISHPPSTRCPSADGTSFLKTIAGRGEMAMDPFACCFPCVTSVGLVSSFPPGVFNRRCSAGLAPRRRLSHQSATTSRT